MLDAINGWESVCMEGGYGMDACNEASILSRREGNQSHGTGLHWTGTAQMSTFTSTIRGAYGYGVQ